MSEVEIEKELIEAIDFDRSRCPWWPSEEMARIAVRRWNSFYRRNKIKRPTTDQKALDLAKGLQAHFDKEKHDCTFDFVFLARILAKILAEKSQN
jgi:hypothetical protein